MSNISALLREAADEVASEEKQDTEEGLLLAAAQTNQEVVGASTPLPAETLSSRAILEKHLDVKEDVHALLEQMALKPKYSGNTIDDVDALINAHKKTTSETSKASMDQYRRRKSARLSSKSVTSSSRMLTTQSWSTAEMSKISVLLAQADEKSWGRDIKYAFASPQQELLFRSMKVVRPTSAAAARIGTGSGTGTKHSRGPGLNATTAPRLQKYTTCDLNIHTIKKDTAEEVEQKIKMHQSMRMSADRLCTVTNKPPSTREKLSDPTLAYSTFDDAKECTFQPKIAGKARKTKKRTDDDDDDDRKPEGDRFAFINRQEAEERNRRDELEFQIGKANYDAKVDKKTCPQCGAKQSYDEFKEKRKSCVHCNVEYCAAVSWGKVGRRFFQSNLEYSQRVAEKKQQLRRQADDEFKRVQRTEVDPATGKTITYLTERKKVLTPEEELEFFDRIEFMLQKREENVKALEEKIYSEKCPFKPSISSRLRSHKGGDSEDEQEEDEDEEGEEGGGAVRAFLKRYKEDLDARRDKYPGKYLHRRDRNEEEDLQPFRISKSIDRKLGSY